MITGEKVGKTGFLGFVIMSTKVNEEDEFSPERTPVDKPVEIVEKCEFSTAISHFEKLFPKNFKCIIP